MVRTASAAVALVVLLAPGTEAQSVGPPLGVAFPSLTQSDDFHRSRSAVLGELQRQHRDRTRGRTFLAYTGLGLVVGAAAGAVAGPLLTTPECLAWKKDTDTQTTCLDAFFDPREHLRGAVILAGVGAVIGAVTGLIARGGP